MTRGCQRRLDHDPSPTFEDCGHCDESSTNKERQTHLMLGFSVELNKLIFEIRLTYLVMFAKNRGNFVRHVLTIKRISPLVFIFFTLKETVYQSPGFRLGQCVISLKPVRWLNTYYYRRDIITALPIDSFIHSPKPGDGSRLSVLCKLLRERREENLYAMENRCLKSIDQ